MLNFCLEFIYLFCHVEHSEVYWYGLYLSLTFNMVVQFKKKKSVTKLGKRRSWAGSPVAERMLWSVATV